MVTAPAVRTVLRNPGLQAWVRADPLSAAANWLDANSSEGGVTQGIAPLMRGRNAGDHHEIHGDFLSLKGEDLLRLGFQNFNGLTEKKNDPVDQSLWQWVTEQQFDVWGISEVNLWWPRMQQSLQFLEQSTANEKIPFKH